MGVRRHLLKGHYQPVELTFRQFSQGMWLPLPSGKVVPGWSDEG
ncbi:hypothetical protein [Streptomyces goshikiensis]